MSQHLQTLYHCGCRAPPEVHFYIYQRRPATRSTTSPDGNVSGGNVATNLENFHTLEFCCSDTCCEHAIQRKQEVYSSLVEEYEQLVQHMEFVGPAEMARFAERLQSAQTDAEEENQGHETCGRDRELYDPGVGYWGRVID